MNKEQLIIAAKTALILKGKFTSLKDAANYIANIFPDLSALDCQKIVGELVNSGKIVIELSLGGGIYEQLNNGYKHTYNIGTVFSLESLKETIKQYYYRS